MSFQFSEEDAREVLLCARPERGLANALERRKPTLVLVPCRPRGT